MTLCQPSLLLFLKIFSIITNRISSEPPGRDQWRIRGPSKNRIPHIHFSFRWYEPCILHRSENRIDNVSDKGKLFERAGRKVTGLKPFHRGKGSGTPEDSNRLSAHPVGWAFCFASIS